MSLMKNPVITGSVGGVIGLLAGVMIGNGSVDGKLNAAMEEALAPVTQSNATQSSALEALSARIESLEGQLAEGASASSDLAGSLGAQLEALKDSIGGAISDTASEQSDALQTALADVRSQISSQAEALKEAAVSATATVREAITEEPSEPEQPEASQESETEPMPSGGADPLGVGQTAVFAEGAVRAFVGRIDEDSAVLTINRVTSTVGAGESVVVRHQGGTCRVGVAQVAADGVEVVSDCDGPVVPEGGVTAVPGQTVMLAQGALRVFVSGIIGGDARLAVNSLDTQLVAVGESVTAERDGQSCSVTVTGVRGNEIGLTGTCG